jgi:hypothetical protein
LQHAVGCQYKLLRRVHCIERGGTPVPQKCGVVVEGRDGTLHLFVLGTLTWSEPRLQTSMILTSLLGRSGCESATP